MTRRDGFCGLAIAVFVFGLAACERTDSAGHERAAVPVRVQTVEKRQDAAATRYSGAISPATQVDISFRASGYVQQILQQKDGTGLRNVQEGDTVKKGSVLAIVRPAELQQRAAAADASASENEAAEKQAQLDFDRTKALFDRHGMTQADLDSASIRLQTAHARLAGARAQAAQAALAVDDTRLVSPIDGVVLKRNVEIGTLVSPGITAFVVADTTSVKVVFGAPDVLAAKLKLGGKVRVSLETQASELDGTVTRIAPSADNSARVFDVEARLPNADGSLKSGMIASLSVPDESLGQLSVMLPLTAVIRSPKDPRGFAAYVVEGPDSHATVHVRDVKLGDVFGNDVVTTEGLALGDRVVCQGASIVTDGSAVRVVP